MGLGIHWFWWDSVPSFSKFVWVARCQWSFNLHPHLKERTLGFNLNQQLGFLRIAFLDNSLARIVQLWHNLQLGKKPVVCVSSFSSVAKQYWPYCYLFGLLDVFSFGKEFGLSIRKLLNGFEAEASYQIETMKVLGNFIYIETTLTVVLIVST